MLVRKTIKKNIQYLNFIVFFFLCLIIWKFSSHYQLSSPFFWDEAWSYMKTINWMLHNKITLFPNQIDPEVSRGHPLGFYFIISSILKIVGDNPRNAHISILVLNILSISILAHTLKRYFNYFVAFSVIMLFVIQECCIIQLPFVLPELLISVLSILSILFFHFKHSRNFIVASTLLVLFKESAINILFVLLLVSISQRYVLKTSHRIQTYLLIPIAIFISNYLLLKIHYGWFFFPLHTGFIKNLSFQGLEQNLSSIFQFVFYEQGRFILSILLLGGIFLKVYQFVRNDEPKFKSMSLSIYFPLVLFMISYIGFSGVNFLMLRYLLPAILVFILILILLINSFSKSHLKYLLPIILLISFISFNITTKNTWIDDCKMNAIDMINVHNEMINYLTCCAIKLC